MTPFSLFGHSDGSNLVPAKRRLLTIDADLSAPPSTAACFRDVTLVANLRGYEVVAVAPADMLSSYSNWFWRHGLHDYVADLVAVGQIASREVSIEIIGGRTARLTAENLHLVISHIPILG